MQGGTPGSDSAGSNVEIHGTIDAGTNAPPPADVVQVPLFARNTNAFEVFENDTKLLDGPGNLEVPKGETRTVVIRAKGFKDKKLVVEGIKKKTVQFTLERVGGAGTRNGSNGTHAGSGSAAPPRPGLDCTNSVVDPSSRACRKQFCKGHPQVGNCILEDTED